MERTSLAARWVAHRRILLIVALGLGLAAYLLVPRLEFNRSIENMFPAGSPVLASYQRLQRTFGGNEIVLAVYQDPQLFAPGGQSLRRVTQIRQRLQQVAGVKAVLSLDQPLPGEMILGGSPLAQRTRELFAGYTHGTDGQTVSIVCMLDPTHETEASRRTTIDQLRAVMQSLPDGLASGYLTGEPTMVVDGFRYVERDGELLGIWATVLLGGTIVLCFRSLRWLVIPVLVVHWTLLTMKSILVLARIELSMVSSMLTAVVMVVGVGTMVHVMVRFGEARAAGQDPIPALESTISDLAWPIFWSCLTDAAGFLALTFSDVGPVQDFGVMMAIGSGMVLLGVALWVPGLTILGTVDVDPRTPWGEGRLVGQLQWVLHAVCRRPWRVLSLFGGLTVVAMMGIGQLRVETDFTRNFRQDSQIARSYRFVEEHLGGAGVCDVVIPAPATLNAEFLGRLRRLGQQIQAEAAAGGPMSAITKSFSVADAVFELSPVQLTDQPQFVQDGLIFSAITAMRGWMPEFFTALYGRDPLNGQDYVRLMLRVQERQDAEQKRALISRLEVLATREFPETEVTGYFVLLSHLIDSVLQGQWRTFFMALLGIALLMTLAFGDLRLAVIALVPNTFPVLVVLGAMGWISRWLLPELRINMGTAMIAAVSMGLSIDSSIHYILAIRRELRAGQSFDLALQAVQGQVGKAVVLSTVALAVGFTVLATSRFVPTVYFGTLVTLAMLGGLVGNLIGLPVLLKLFYRPALDAPPATLRDLTAHGR